MGCMRTRCLGFHERGEGHWEWTTEKLGDMAVLNYLDQWKKGNGACVHVCVFQGAGLHSKEDLKYSAKELKLNYQLK